MVSRGLTVIYVDYGNLDRLYLELRYSLSTLLHWKFHAPVDVVIDTDNDDTSPVMAHVLPLARTEFQNQLEPFAIAAIFIRDRENARDNAELLATTFELTPAETRLLSRPLPDAIYRRLRAAGRAGASPPLRHVVPLIAQWSRGCTLRRQRRARIVPTAR
jgi:hypothetical protein